MSSRNSLDKCRRWIASSLALMMALGPLATPGYAALTLLSDQPLSVQNQSKPNIMLTIDDSSSMLYDFLPDSAISKYCRDATGNMNAACGQFDSNVDLSLIGHGKYVTPGFVYEQFGFPFPAYNSSFDTSGPGAGCDTTILATSTCSGGIDPGPLPGIERYPGPPAPGRSPKAGKAYEYWTLWPAPVHNTELNRAYYNPRITYEPPIRADGTSYPQMTAANTINFTHVPADPWATTIKYVDLTAQVTIGFWCNSDWSQGLEGDQRYCRTNGTGPSAATSSTSSTDGDYNYPWAPPGIDPTAGSTTAFSVAFGKVDATSHALLPAWATAKDPKYFFQNDNVIWCDSTSPLWPNYGPLQPQTCTDPAPINTPQVCQGVTDQTCGGGAPQTCVGVTPQVCNNAQPQTCNNINNQTCSGVTPQACTGQQPQTCTGTATQTCGGIAPQSCNAVPQTCAGVAPQTCNGAVFPTCINSAAQSCDGAINQTCGGITPQSCDGTISQFCQAIVPQTCDNVQSQTCNPLGEVCNLPDPNSCPVEWNRPECPCAGSECSDCHLVHVCPPGNCSVTGGQCNANAECPGTRQCSVSGNACNVTADCAPQQGSCSINPTACLVAADCPNLGQCSNVHNACATNADCPLLAGTCSIIHNTCTSGAECQPIGQCTNSLVACTNDAACPNTQGHCSATAAGCSVSGDCPNAGQCSNNSNTCLNDGQCPAVPGNCSTDNTACFNNAQCPDEGHCTADSNICTTNAQCPTLPGVCSTDGAPCLNAGQCPAEGTCTIVGNICQADAQCPNQPGTCTISGAACFTDVQCPDLNGQCTVTSAACTVDANCPTVNGTCNLDASVCHVNGTPGDCPPSGQCSVTNAVCHNLAECPTVSGTCSSVPTACTTDANCPTLVGHCSIETTLACTGDAGCAPAGNHCSTTGESCTGATYDPYCQFDAPPYTCTQPAYCPRQGGTCSVDGSACVHGFFPPFFDYTYCPGVFTPGKCSVDHNTCSSDAQCPPVPTASAAAVCSDLVAGTTTLTVPVPNGNFEAPYVGNYQANPPGSSWTWSGSSGIQRYFSAFGAYPSSDLWQTAFIQGAGSMSQTIALPAGSYRVSFQAARRSYSVPAGTYQPIVVSVDGVPLGAAIAPTIDFQFNSFAFGFSIAAAGPHTITFAGTDGSGDKTTFIDLVAITSGTSLLEDANGAGLVCRHNNKAYGAVVADRFNFPNAQFNTPVTAGDGPNACTPSPRYASVPRHYYKTGVQWCDHQIATVGDKWLGYGTGSCVDAADSTHLYPRFYQFGQDPTLIDNYATPAFQRVDLLPLATYAHSWTDESGDPQTITRSYGGASPNVSEMTNYANWFAYYRTRITATKSVTSLTFSELNDKYRVGFHNLFNLASFVNIADFTPAQKTLWFNQLFGVQIPLGQETPSLTAVARIGEYYLNGTHPQLSGSTDPIVLACQKNYHLFFTDGFTNQSGLPSVVVGDQDDVVPAYPDEGTNPIPGLVSGSAWPAPFREDITGTASNSLSDYAMKYWVTDMRTVGPQSANTVISSLRDPAAWQHQNFAAVSLGTSGKLNASNVALTEGLLAGGSLQWPKPYPTVFRPDNSGVDDLWHAAVNGRGRFVNAQSPDEAKFGIGKIFLDIANQSGVRAGVGFQSINLGSTVYVYRTAFEPNWGGSLAKIQIDPNTTPATVIAQAWEASTQLDAQLTIIPTVIDTPWFTERKIVTMNESGTAVPFLWANLGANQRDSLAPGKPPARGQLILEFLRGSRLKEGDKLGKLRQRPSALGDFADSGAIYVGPPTAPYRDSDDPGYGAFKSTYSGRAARIYAGANDGMLHAFDDTTGNETWAYIPSVLYRGGLAGGDVNAGLGALAYQDGALPPFKHHYYVDGTVRVLDVNFAAETAGLNWRSILVGGLGKGGAAYYAVDVTDPSAITTEAAAAARVLWEFKPADIGYSYGRPVIAKTRAFNGTWLVVLTTGYNNPSGVGKLYFVRASDGQLMKTLSTGVGSPGSPSGLAHPSGFTKDYHNQLAEQFYAGDLIGNLWRFDVSDPDPNNWTVGQLGSMVDAGGTPQPVTTPPQIEVDISNGVDRWVFVGTGKLYDDSDQADNQLQTFYAFRDGTADAPWPLPAIPVSRSTVGMEFITNSAALDFGLAGKPAKGWFDDLPVGQRIVVPPQAALSIAAYIGTSAQSDPCLTGMQATIYARDYSSGKSDLVDSGTGDVVQSIAIAEGGVGLDIVSVSTGVGGVPDIRLVITPALKNKPPIFIKPKPPSLLSQHRMSWRLLGE
ncbi:MAG: PilC/PilY family type IV pilus protein [Casimicrobiaceae bacterium]